MGHYIANLRDIEFCLFDLLEREEILGKSTSLLGSAFLDEESNNKMEWKRDIYALGVSESVLESVCK